MLIPVHPAKLSAALIDTLRSIPELIALLGDPENIRYYLDRGDLLAEIANQAAGTILVVRNGRTPRDSGRRQTYEHQYLLIIKPPNVESGDPNIVDDIE